jgi:hypothetical protein
MMTVVVCAVVWSGLFGGFGFASLEEDVEEE